LAAELLKRNGIVSPRAAKQKAAAGGKPAPKFWPYNK
jgi:hypothetical protein